jgi:O-acetyl-ADP-ribose deacetylase (regulator of RNase III)
MNGSLDVTIRNGDLSKESCDVIVNPTNVSMCPDGGLDSLVHQSMGQFFTDQVVAIHKDMKANSCPHGQSRIFIAKFTREENDARYVISTVGPLYSNEDKDRAAFLLKSCYYTSLALANLYQLSSIAYPAISCGANGFPADEAANVAIESIRNYSYNVKDVRFVLYDRWIYDTFVQEWTNYAQRVNREANISDQITSDTTSESPQKSKIPPKPSARYCVLCKERQLPIDRQLLCLNCSNLTRPELFSNFLSNLRAAAEKSYDDLRKECQLLKPILKSYPLAYNPAQIFDQSIHQRDPVAEHYLQSHCDKAFRNKLPMAIVGDGNCFYNTFVKLGGVGTTTDASTLTPVELRARNIVELVLNVDVYRSQYYDLSTILDNFEKYVREEMVRDTNYVAIWDLLSIPTVLNIQMISIYPKVNGPDDLHCRYLNGKLYIPLQTETDVDNQEKQTETSTIPKEVKLLFSNCNRPSLGLSKNKKDWLPNHFVPLLGFS